MFIIDQITIGGVLVLYFFNGNQELKLVCVYFITGYYGAKSIEAYTHTHLSDMVNLGEKDRKKKTKTNQINKLS